METPESVESRFIREKSFAIRAFSVLLLVTALFVAVQMVSELREYRFIGQDIAPQKTITVRGEGETVAVPDIATLFISVEVERPTVSAAQEEAARRTNEITAFLDEQKIDEKDVKTSSYNIYPQYDYVQETCIRFPCPPGRQELRGYRVTQTLEVSVRDIENIGVVLAGAGELGATNINGPNFGFDDDDALKEEARRLAIQSAKQKARRLAKELGVELLGVVNFSEQGGFPMPLARDAVFGAAVAEEGVPAPDIPAGENKVMSSVTITYQIR